MDDDVSMFNSDLGVDDDDQGSTKHFIVAVDFGTTYSSVAYVSYGPEWRRRELSWKDVDVIDGYPGWPYLGEPARAVPSETWYPNSGQRRIESQHPVADDDEDDEDDDDDDQNLRSSDEDESDAEYDSDAEHGASLIDVPALKIGSGSTPPLHWGYGVHTQVKIADEFDTTRRIHRSKLLLHVSDKTIEERTRLKGICDTLKRKGLIKTDNDVISHFLEQLFRLTHERLVTEGFNYNSKLEVVLCVPPAWTASACRRMNLATRKAIEKSGLGDVKNDCIGDLFLVAEPEAAATYAVSSGKVDFRVGETVLFLDAGGFTVDAATYTIDESYPLRFETEEVELESAECGSSFINEKFLNLLQKELQHENYLTRDGEAFTRLCDRLLIEFEQHHKLMLDQMFPDNVVEYPVAIEGLKCHRKKKHLQSNKLFLSPKKIRQLFMDSAEGVAQLMKSQIEAAHTRDCPKYVKKVILMGGYGQSRSLVAHLKRVLSSKAEYSDIELICPRVKLTAVSEGAVLRALRKEEGPNRVLQTSYGFLLTEPYMDALIQERAHQQQKPWRHKTDGLLWIPNAVRWIIHKGHTIPTNQEFILSIARTFGIKTRKFIWQETVVVADRYPDPDPDPDPDDMDGLPTGGVPTRPSHYQLNHPKNAGAEIVGQIEFDITHLKDKGIIKWKRAPKRGMSPYYKVEAELYIYVNGRNLRYEVCFSNDEGDVLERKIGMESLAPAFMPGTE